MKELEKKKRITSFKSIVNPKVMDVLEDKIFQEIVVNKKYKDKTYSAKQLAIDLGTNTRYISTVINTRFHANYTTFVNKYRIEEAMKMLKDPRYQDLNVEDIAIMVGFANRQSFYTAFERMNSLTPREYKQKHIQY